MIGKIVSGKDGDHFFVDGTEVSEKEFWRAFPPKKMASDGECALSAVPVMHSEGLAVHPRQIAAATESAKNKGVPTDFDKHGRPIFTSRDHQRRYSRAYGFHNRDDNWSGRDDQPKEKSGEELMKEYFDG